MRVHSVLFTLLCIGSINAQQLQEVSDFGANPGKLRMFVHLPKGRDPSIGPLPLVVALHGCTQNAEELLEVSGWDKLADLRGFVLLCPEQRGANNVTHCFNWFRRKDAYGDEGEARSIVNMIEHAKKQWPIDPDRVYVYGVSAGAAMAVDLMVASPTIFRMGASIAGGPFLGDANAIKAMRTMVGPQDLTPEAWRAVVTTTFPNNKGPWPNLIVMHGSKDHIVDPQASVELIDQWAGLHGTDAIPDTEEFDFDGHPGVARVTYNDANGNVVITYYTFADLGHALAIDPGEGPCHGGKVGSRSIDLDLHSTCVIADGFGL